MFLSRRCLGSEVAYRKGFRTDRLLVKPHLATCISLFDANKIYSQPLHEQATAHGCHSLPSSEQLQLVIFHPNAPEFARKCLDMCERRPMFLTWPYAAAPLC